MSLWTKIFGEPDDWRFVCKHCYTYRHKESATHDWKDAELTYYLYENQDGDRKFDVIDGVSGRGDLRVNSLRESDWVFRNKAYREKIHPWLSGFRDPEYPTYDKVKQRDMKRLLKTDKK